jgi:hypothetical protein
MVGATHLSEGLRVTGVNFRHIGPEQGKNVRIYKIPTEKNLMVLTVSFCKSRYV